MNRADIEEWIAHPNAALNRMTIADFKELCDLALRGLKAGEPTNREKIYGPLLDKLKPKADEPVAVVYVADPIPEGSHPRQDEGAAMDLKALRREIADETSAKMEYDMEWQRDLIEAALIQYAEAVLGEPSEGMIDASEFANGAAEIWEVMGMKRLREIK